MTQVADPVARDARRLRFPAGFLWGAATSSHQVEGGNRYNDWWEHEESGRLPHRSGDACRQWELYDSDFEMAEKWGHSAHRFSLEWSRIEPKPGRWSDEALDHYRGVARSLLQRGLEPVVTLHHFTCPAWFARGGGWLRADAPRLFSRYVERTVRALPSQVRFFVTINEPTVYAKHAFVVGDWPPFTMGAWNRAVRALRQLATGHDAAYRVLRRERPHARVGFAHSVAFVEPCNRRRIADRAAARIREFFLNHAFLRLLGIRTARPRTGQPLDFLGVNYYARQIVRAGRRGTALPFGEECPLDHHPDRGAISDTGWEVYPRGLQKVLERLSELGVPLLVTENGVATDDEALRLAALEGHLASLGRAVEGGAPVIGYLYWSLIDNYEWTLGTTARFGLAAVDFATQARTARPAAAAFAEACRSNAITVREDAP